MKILLINEASGVHALLKKGLTELGHEVYHVIAGSGPYQGRTVDLCLGNAGNDFLSKLKRNLLPYWKIRKLKNGDIVNFILGLSAFSGKYNRYHDLTMFKNANVKLSYIGAGCDEISLLRVRPDVDNLPCKSCMINDDMGRCCEKSILSLRAKATHYAGLFDFAITPIIEYDHCHEFFPNAIHTRIPFPINVKTIEYVPADSQKRKPLIIHSPTRRGFKGTNIVIDAINLLRDKYRDFDFQLIEGFAYKNYLEAMKRCDIYIDQVLSYSTGMAALEILAMGKIVLSGNLPNAGTYFPFSKESPIFQAIPEPVKLAETLLHILSNKEDFHNLSLRGRQFVEKYHDHVHVSRLYLNLWRQSLA